MDAKQFLFVSADAALITDLAWQVHREGHDVRYYIEAESDREIGDGFVPKTDDWRGDLDWADVVVFETDSREGIHIEEAKRVSPAGTATGAPTDPRAPGDAQWRVAGESGMPVVVTGKGETMQAAREQCYARVDRILRPNCYYRDDIGERWVDGDGDRLQAWGYLGPAA